MRDVDPIDLVETIREGLLVLEPDLIVRFANRSFCNTFAVAREDTVGRKLYKLGNGQWDIPELRSLIQTIVPEHASVEAFKVDHVFPSIGRRVMLLNARKVYRPGSNIEQILLGIEDVTERMQLEREHSLAHQRIEMLLQELTHRVKNSLQTIAAIVRIEARHHKSGEGKGALEQVSNRISAIGRLYANLENAGAIGAIDASIYLKEVCANLIASVQQGGRAIPLKTDIASELLPTERTIPIGLIVNELVMNAIKYAFPNETGGTVIVALKRESGELRLTVADDGSGADFKPADSGLGGQLVEGFAQQLGGRLAEFVDCYNTRRYHESLNNLTPCRRLLRTWSCHSETQRTHQATNHQGATPAAPPSRSVNINPDEPDPLLNPAQLVQKVLTTYTAPTSARQIDGMTPYTTREQATGRPSVIWVSPA